MSQVVLPPVNSDIYRRSTVDPQYVTPKNPPSAMIYFNSQDATTQVDKTDVIFSTKSGTATILGNNITRLAINEFSVGYYIPNVNPRNNTLRFLSTISTQSHEVTITPGYYSTALSLITQIVTDLNLISGASGITFSFAPYPGLPDTYTLTGTGQFA